MQRIRMIGIAAVLALVVAIPAQGQKPDKGRDKDEHQDKGKHQDDGKHRENGEHQDNGNHYGQAKQEARQQARLSEQEQQARIAQQQQRVAQYRQYLNQRTVMLQQQSAQLQQQRRAAQFRVQQQYLANLRAQQARLQTPQNYSVDPYYSTRNSYRYVRSGTAYQTNQYGAEALQRAVNYGYQQGVASGQADRQDGYTSGYQSSYAYQDANYGYDGSYVSQADYNYYFRQGFQRGYQDGNSGRLQYGTTANGTTSILRSLASTILGLKSTQ